MVKVKNINRSSIKTRRKIKDAFAQLVNEKKEFSNITVTELVKRADITRSTFYTHYDSIYDVAKDFQNEALELISIDGKTLESIDDIDRYLDTIVAHLRENENIYKMLLSSNDALIFMERLNVLVKKHLYNGLVKYGVKDKQLNLKVTFFTDGCLNLFIRYYRDEVYDSLQSLSDFVKIMFRELFFE
jgi:AcrR family transcriptional regulator